MAERVEIKMSAQLKEKVEAAREYIENKYSKLRKTEEDRRNNWNMFEEKANDMRLSEEQKDRIRQEILQQEAELLRKKYSQ
jgi:serine/threonine kinase 38